MLEMTTHRIPIDDGQLYAESAGAGPAVVLLHGGTFDAKTWNAQVAALAASYPVIRYDARSHGRSSTATRDHRADDDLLALLEALHLTSVALVGLSMGGRTATDFALVHPDKVWALVLSGPGISPMRFEDEFVAAAHAEQAAAIQAPDAERYVEAFLRYSVDGPTRQPADTDPIMRRRLHDSALATVAAHHTAVGQMLEREAVPHLDQIEVPTLLLVGDLDMRDIHRVVAEAERRLPRARRLEIAGGGHMLNIEQPEEFNAAVLAHLDQHRPASSDSGQ